MQATQVGMESDQIAEIGSELDLGAWPTPSPIQIGDLQTDHHFLLLFPCPIALSFFMDTIKYLLPSVPYYSTLDDPP